MLIQLLLLQEHLKDTQETKQQKNKTNRLNNCEQANTDKIVSAATTQLKNIAILETKLATTLLGEDGDGGVVGAMKEEIEAVGDLSEQYITLQDEIDKTIAKYSVLHDSEQLFATKYMAYMPTEEELRKEIEQQKRLAK